ncbi:MAG TPA: hypothetical protein VFM77_12810, partial [Terriglobales bacterium]|nr:hypothetical protein [Terriglobales bacterium]
AIGLVSYGVDINAVPGDLINQENSSPTALPNPSPIRLNPSFGQINYADNDRYGNYESVYFNVKGRFSRGFIDASYTRSSSKDDALNYPDSALLNAKQYYGPSVTDAPNRLSLSFNYSLKGLNNGSGAVGLLTGGWGISGTSIFQSGYPITAVNFNGFVGVCQSGALTNGAGCSASDPVVAYATGSGDYTGNGDNYAYPDAVSYSQSTNNKSWLTGAIPKSDFATPTFGQQGNEKAQRLRGPNFYETDVNFYKDTHITERVNFQLRFEFFNLFNRANYTNVDTNFPDSNFGVAGSSHQPRFWQIGGRISF